MNAESHETMEETAAPEWFVSWFNHPAYLKLYQHRNQKEATETIDLILKATGLNPAETAKPVDGKNFIQPLKALDIACGAGRHAIALAERGFWVTANDLSPALIQEAQRAAAATTGRKLGIDFIQRDMRSLTDKNKYDLIVQLFTSFGYFEQRADDERVVQSIYAALKSGGWYVLDFFNKDHVLKNLQPESHNVIDGVQVHEERKIIGDTIQKNITLVENENLTRFKESVRLYGYDDLAHLLLGTGFRIRKVFGDYLGGEFNPITSPRLMFVVQKISER
jgi:SAM-dependent methyltransferase